MAREDRREDHAGRARVGPGSATGDHAAASRSGRRAHDDAGRRDERRLDLGRGREEGAAPCRGRGPCELRRGGRAAHQDAGHTRRPFAAITSMPSMGRPPALSTVFAVRGAAPEETVTFLDGAPLPQAFHFGGLVSVVPAPMLSSRLASCRAASGRLTAARPRASSTPGSPRRRATASTRACSSTRSTSAPRSPRRASKGRRETTPHRARLRRSHVDTWIGSAPRRLRLRRAPALPRRTGGPRARLRVPHAFVRGAVLFAGRRRLGHRSQHLAHRVVEVLGAACPRAARVEVRRRRHGARRVLCRALQRQHPRRRRPMGERSQDPLRTPRDHGPHPRPRARAAHLRARTRSPPASTACACSACPPRRSAAAPCSTLRGSIAVQRVEPGVLGGARARAGARRHRHPGPAARSRRTRRRAVAAAARAPRRAVVEHRAQGAPRHLRAEQPTYDAVDARDFDGTLLPVAAEPGPVRGAHGGLGIEHALSREVQVSCDVWARASNGPRARRPAAAGGAHVRRAALGAVASSLGYYYPLNADTPARGRSASRRCCKLLGRERTQDSSATRSRAPRSATAPRPRSAARRSIRPTCSTPRSSTSSATGGRRARGSASRSACSTAPTPRPRSRPRTTRNVDPNRPLPQLRPIHSLDLRLEKTFRVGARHGGRVRRGSQRVRPACARAARVQPCVRLPGGRLGPPHHPEPRACEERF